MCIEILENVLLGKCTGNAVGGENKAEGNGKLCCLSCGKMLSNEICNMRDTRERERDERDERELWAANISLFNWVRADLMCVRGVCVMWPCREWGRTRGTLRVQGK